MGAKARDREKDRLEKLKGLEEIRRAHPAKMKLILRKFGKLCYDLGYSQAVEDFQKEISVIDVAVKQ